MEDHLNRGGVPYGAGAAAVRTPLPRPGSGTGDSAAGRGAEQAPLGLKVDPARRLGGTQVVVRPVEGEGGGLRRRRWDPLGQDHGFRGGWDWRATTTPHIVLWEYADEAMPSSCPWHCCFGINPSGSGICGMSEGKHEPKKALVPKGTKN